MIFKTQTADETRDHALSNLYNKIQQRIVKATIDWDSYISVDVPYSISEEKYLELIQDLRDKGYKVN